MQLYQYYTAFCANLLGLGYGIFLGWTSPILPLLQSNDTPLASGPITKDESTTISSVLFLGNLTGTIVIGLVADKFGRKVAIYLIALPMMTFWILIIFAENVFLIYIARVIGGFSGGGCYLVIPLYVSEIAEDNIRGILGSLLQVIVNLGMSVGFIWGAFLNYYVMAYLSLIFPVMFMIGFLFVPESPAYLIAKGRYAEAIESLKFFRGYKNSDQEITEEVQAELKAMEIKSKEKQFKFSDLTVADFTNRSARRGIIISIIVLIMTQACGSFVLLNYAAMVFEEAGSTFSPNVSSIVVGLLQFMGSIVSPVLVERAGRKILLCASGISTGLCLAIFGTYLYLRETGVDVTDYSWISVVTVAGAIVNSSWGMITLPYVIVTEVLSIQIRGTIAIIGRVCMAVVGFLFLKFYFNLTELIGSYGAQWMFAGFCFAYIAFIIIYLPETKGRSVDDIVKSLEK